MKPGLRCHASQPPMLLGKTVATDADFMRYVTEQLRSGALARVFSATAAELAAAPEAKRTLAKKRQGN